MKAIIPLLTAFLLPFTLFADTNKTQSSWGEVEGLVRAYYVFDNAYIKSGSTIDYKIDASAIGGHLRYKTPVWSGLGATTALYYAQDTGLNNFDDPNTIAGAGRFFTSDYSPKAILGELNLHYKSKEHYGTVGRMKIDSPLTNAITTYMSNMFEAALYENNALDHTKITLAHAMNMAYGSRAPVEFGLIGEKTFTAGVTQPALDTRGEFINVGSQVLQLSDGNLSTAGATTAGITAFSLTNTSLPHTKIRLWDFYGHDIINMFYLDALYKDKKAPWSVAAQYLRIDGVGENLASAFLDDGNAYMLGLKGTYQYKKALLYLAYNHSGDAKILNPWGGDPAYTSAFFSKNAYRSNVDAFKLGVNYAIKPNLKFLTSYAYYGKSTTSGTFPAINLPDTPDALALGQNDAIETSFLVSYNPIKKLNILTGLIYKTSEYYYQGSAVEIFDVDLLVTYKF